MYAQTHDNIRVYFDKKEAFSAMGVTIDFIDIDYSKLWIAEYLFNDNFKCYFEYDEINVYSITKSYFVYDKNNNCYIEIGRYGNTNNILFITITNKIPAGLVNILSGNK